MSKTSTNIDPSAQVSDKATIGQGCHIGSRTRILGPAKICNDVYLDANVTLYGNVTVQDSTYIGADCIIPPRDYGKRMKHHKYSYRHTLIREGYDEDKYHQRNKVETVNSVIKRLFGEVLRARIWVMQKKEMLAKILAYNIRRIVKLKRI